MTESPDLHPAYQSKAKKDHSGAKFLLVVVLILAILVLASAVAAVVLLAPSHGFAKGIPTQVVLKKGMTTEQIADKLASVGVVGNALMFRIHAKLSPQGADLKPGVYDLATGMSDDEVIAKLAKGIVITYYEVPIPEGFTAKQIAARFAKRAHMDPAIMLDLVTTGASQFEQNHPYLKGAYNGSLEGFLFPATYQVKAGTTPTAAVEMMLNKFDAEIANVDLTKAAKKNLTLTDVVTIASILEREAQLNRDYPKIASVIYNRLHAKMRLQLDSTVYYAAPEGTVKLSQADLLNPSPYNTYRHPGLPPGPISNPGLLALKAAANPAKTPYYYYVLTGKDGSQTFTTNYADFLKAVNKFHKVFGK